MKNVSFYNHENIAKNLVFVDGLARAGKSLFSSVLPSLKRFEHINFFNLLEQVLPAVSFGKVSVNYAKTLIRVYLNELIYNIRIGRNVNFRYADQSGALNYRDPKTIFQRLGSEEGNSIVQELKTSDSYFPFQTHDMLVNLEYLNLLDIDFRMIALFRHPIDNIYSWWTRGWGERFGKDPLAFTIAIDYNCNALPWYCLSYEEEWLALNPMERCIRTATDLIERSVQRYKETPNKKDFYLLAFEDFVQNPDEEIKKICLFFKTETTVYTPQAIQLERCPRVLKPEDRKRKLSEFQANVKRELFDVLVGISKSYETDFYGLR